MLIAQFVSSYKKPALVAGKPATVVFRYTVSGSEEELKDYKDIQGEKNYRVDKDNGRPLWFTTRFFSDRVKLIITTNESTGERRIVADDSEITKIQSIVQTYGADVARLVLSTSPAVAAE